MKKFGQHMDKPWVAYTIAACAAVAFYMLLSHFSPILSWLKSIWKMFSPVVIGIVLAYITNPVATFFEAKLFGKLKKESAKRTISSLLALLCVLLIVALFISLLIPSLVDSVTKLINNSDSYYDKLDLLIQKLNDSKLGLNLSLDSLIESAEDYANDLLNTLMNNLSSILTTASTVGSSIFNWLIGFIMAIYFLIGKSSIVSGLNHLRRLLLNESQFRSRTAFWKRCHEIFIQYIGCNLLDALIVCAANALFMLITSIPDVALISVVIGVTNLLPTFGPIIGAVIGCFILLIQQPSKVLLFLIFTFVLQTIDGYVIKPKLFSSSFGIPAVWTLVAIVLGGKLAGVAGILLATPVAAVIAMIYKDTLLPRLERRKSAAKDKGGPKPEP